MLRGDLSVQVGIRKENRALRRGHSKRTVRGKRKAHLLLGMRSRKRGMHEGRGGKEVFCAFHRRRWKRDPGRVFSLRDPQRRSCAFRERKECKRLRQPRAAENLRACFENGGGRGLCPRGGRKPRLSFRRRFVGIGRGEKKSRDPRK